MKNVEIWKDIQGYEGLYQVSNHGNIRSFQPKGNGSIPHGMKLHEKRGYYQVGLRNNSKKKYFAVHRIVATAFIPNKDNLPCINHKDENKLNNHVENLEWCTYAYNNTYGDRIERVKSKTSVAVMQFDLCGNFIARYPSLADAQRATGVLAGNISACLSGKYAQANGFVWKREEGVVTSADKNTQCVLV